MQKCGVKGLGFRGSIHSISESSPSVPVCGTAATLLCSSGNSRNPKSAALLVVRSVVMATTESNGNKYRLLMKEDEKY